ncbi:MAG: PAS domain S-box protein [Dehalococcoidia bacterium]
MRLAAERTETESLFETLSNKSPVGLCIIQDGKLCYTNPTFRSNTGYREDELLGRDSLEIVVPEDRERVRENAIKMLKGELTLPYQFRVTHKDGSIHWVMESVASVQYRGRPATLGNFVDVTAHKQIQEQHKLFAEHSMDIIYCLRLKDEHYIYLSPAVERMLGYTAQEALALQTKDVLTQESYEKQKSEMLKDLENGVLQRTLQLEAVHKDGHIVPIEVHASFISDETGQPVEIVGIVRDITERKQQELAYKTIIQTTVDGFLLMDMQGRFLEVNDAYSRLIGYGRDELLMMNISDIEVIEKPGETAARIARIREVGGDHFETHHKRKDGSIVDVEVSVNYLKVSGGRLVSFIRDITTHKQANEALQAERNKLQSLIDTIDYTITIQDPEYNIIYQNEPSRIASGGDHRGEKCYRAYEGRETVCDGCPVEEAFQDGETHTTERRTAIAGKVAFWENTATPIRDSAGKVVSCLELARDITERKQAEEVLQAERNKLQSVIDALADDLTIQDTEYNIIFMNEPARISSGGDRVGEKCYRVYEGQEGICEDCPVEKAFKNGKPHTAERQQVTPSGEVTFWENTANPIKDARGRVVSCLEIGRNITERKKAEQALADEATRRRILIDQSRDGIVILDQNGKVYEANKQFAEMLGYTPEEAAELHMWHWDTQWSREQLLKMVRSVDAAGDHFETYHRRKDGSTIDVEISTNGAMFAGQKLVFCVCRDITERKQARETLQAEKNKLQSLIDAMEDGLNIMDRDYNIIYQNEPLKEIYGDHIGEKCYRVYAHKDKICDNCPVAMAFRDGKSHSVEKDVTLPSGKVVCWEPTANPIRDAKGKIVSCLEITRDITERKKQEQALADELTRRRLLVDQSLDGIVVIDENDKVYEANQRFAEMLGYTLEEARELHTWDWEKNLSREQIHELGGKADEKGFILDTTHTRKDGSVIDVDISINAAMFGGQKLIFCVCRDVTKRKKQEQALADELTQRRLLINKSLDGIVVLDEDARVCDVNQRFAEMLGYTLEEVHKLHTWDWDKNFPPEKILEMGRNVDEKGLHLETKHTRKDGSVIDVDISISGIMYGGRKLIFCIDRDVTERNRAEEALKNSEESYRELADSITEIFFAMDEHLRYTYWNKASEILTGVRAEDALGKSLLEIFPDTSGTRRAEKVYRAVLRTQKPQTFVNDFDIDGRHYIFEIGAYPSRGGISIFVRDITERKEAEEALRQSEEKYRALFDSTVTGTIVIDAETMKVVMANQAAVEMFGLSSVEEGIGVNPLDFAPPEDKEGVLKLIIKELFEQNLQQTREVRMITKDGRKIWVSATAARIMHEGRLAGLVSLTDITERKKMEEAIKHAAEEWRKTFDSISDAISIHDRDHKILRANKAFADIFHKKPRQIIGKYCYELHSGNKPISGCPHKQTLATKEPAAAEFYESNLGKYLHESTSPIFDEEGEVVGTVHITRDVTEQKQQNERLMMAGRLASIGELAAGTAHELNNPLTSVIGFSQLLMEKDIPDDIREDLKLIHNEAQRAAGVTKNLLAFARKQAPVKQLNQINNTIEDVLKLRAYEHKVNSIEVQRQLAPDLPEIEVDYSQMQQVFLNIIINAEYFMTEAHKKGTLTITTKKQNSTARISIADDGPGISKENLSRIFDPFFTTKEAGKGTGLGLSICHGIVAEHGGQMYARSQPGKGATIVVELPINSH